MAHKRPRASASALKSLVNPSKRGISKPKQKSNQNHTRTFVLSAIEVTGFPRLSTRSVPYAIAFASVLSVFLIDFAFCNISTIHFFLIELATQILINELIRETKTFIILFTKEEENGARSLSLFLSACPLSSSFSLILEKTFTNNRF